MLNRYCAQSSSPAEHSRFLVAVSFNSQQLDALLISGKVIESILYVTSLLTYIPCPTTDISVHLLLIKYEFPHSIFHLLIVFLGIHTVCTHCKIYFSGHKVSHARK